MRDERMAPGDPPVARDEAAHHAVATAAVPHEQAARLEYPRPLGNDAVVVTRIEKKPERGEEVEHRVEAPRPSSRQPTHVAVRVSQPWPGSASPRDREQI